MIISFEREIYDDILTTRSNHLTKKFAKMEKIYKYCLELAWNSCFKWICRYPKIQLRNVYVLSSPYPTPTAMNMCNAVRICFNNDRV